MKYLRKIYVGERETDDSLHYLNQEKILNLGEDEESETITTDGTSWGGEVAPMEIDELIKILNELKGQSAHYVEIMYHVDHDGYVINGVHMREANDMERELHKLEKANNNISKKKEKIALLKQQLKELENE